MTQSYDAIIIGAGQAGNPLALALARAGRHTALIERRHVGGTCVNTGCTPTKTMIASARTAYLARRAADYGIHVGDVRVNFDEVRARKDDIVQKFRSGSEGQIDKEEKLELIYGEARFTATHTLIVTGEAGDTEITAPLIFLNTGARASALKVEGIERVEVLNEESLMNLPALPEHLIIVGGGYISLEFGQMFQRFGSRVTIIEPTEQVMGREDADIAQAVTDILREESVDILLNTKVERVEPSDSGVRLTVSANGQSRPLDGSHLMVAVGRTPNTDKLGLDAAGVEMDERGFIKVNEWLETNIPGVYALGDVKGGPAFTHISYDDFRIVQDHILGDKRRTIHDRPVPYALFTDPQLGRVGLSEKEAREKGVQYRLATMPMSQVARARETDETRGIMKVLIGEDDQILGCAILGIEGGEIMSLLQIAMIGNVPYTAIRDGVFAHPTIAESLNNLFADVK